MEGGGAAAPAVVLVGNPNVGKSALFGALTGTYVTVSNYPGTTVEVTRGRMALDGRPREVVDTPGASSFLPFSEDERVTRDILLAGGAHAAVLVADAKNLPRAVLLALQLAEMELPFVLCLNMMDEAAARGLRFDLEGLSGRLGVEVVPAVAVRGEGVARLREALREPRLSLAAVAYPQPVESALRAAEPLLPPSAISRRALALMCLAGDRTLGPWLAARLERADLERLEDIGQRLRARLAEPVAWVVAQARQRAAGAIVGGAVTGSPNVVASGRRRQRLEAWTTHPVAGLPLLAAILYLAYLFVGVFGAGTLVGLLEHGLFGKVISPAAVAAADRWLGSGLLRDLLVGPYGLITMALAYSLALVLPIVGTFRAVLPMVLGLGCDTMATLTTRILETPKERLIVILLLALGVPCSAQLTVVLTLMAGLSPLAFAIWALVVGGVILVVGRLAAALLPGRGSMLVLELPPLRLPRLGNILVKTLARVEWYLKEAVPLFVAGTLILFVADRLRLLGGLERLAEPVLAGALGLPRETAAAFVVGFLRRDFGAAGLYRLAQQGRLDRVQVLVAVVTLTLFIPCIANFFMIVKERGWRTAAAVAGFVFPFALAVGAALNALLRALDLPL
jgi:ferrous iron transport protein B